MPEFKAVDSQENAASFTKPRIRLLVVDDESHLEILLAQKFRQKIKAGEYQFFFAQNGNEALSCMSQNPGIDLVITDINMPEMDGITLLRRLQNKYEKTKTMVMSAYSDEKSRHHAQQAGAIKFITKPISLKELEDTIEATIEIFENIDPSVTESLHKAT
ncbi:response regulator [Alphaproteobacteria bacterium]|nr:response regulator [Alphaproteobacteria bacterium]